MEKSRPKHLEKCRQIESQILELVGIPVEFYSIKECKLSGGRHIHYVHISKVERKPDNVLLMTHGYLNSNMGFFKMYGGLMDQFHIISFDLPGQGLSSSERKTPGDIGGWLDYFLGSIREFVLKLGLEKFHVLGHSLGAYVLTHFAGRFPEMVLKMFLLSPAGVNAENPEFETDGRRFIDQQSWGLKFVANKLVDKMFVDKKSPLDFFGVSLFRKLIARKVYSADRLRLSKAETKLFVKLFEIIFDNEPSSEKCVGYLFKNGPMSDKPLMPILEKLHLQKKIHIFYGALDWMDFELTTKRVIEKELSVTVKHLDNCGHQIPFQNPEAAVQEIWLLFWNMEAE